MNGGGLLFWGGGRSLHRDGEGRREEEEVGGGPAGSCGGLPFLLPSSSPLSGREVGAMRACMYVCTEERKKGEESAAAMRERTQQTGPSIHSFIRSFMHASSSSPAPTHNGQVHPLQQQLLVIS